MVINLVSGFIFKPLLTTLAKRWSEGSKRGFVAIIAKGLLAVFATSVLALLIAYPLGIPVLSFLYGVDLSEFRSVLLVLLVGGGFNAASVILYYGIITTRHQNIVLPGYALAAAVAFLLTNAMMASWRFLCSSSVCAMCITSSAGKHLSGTFYASTYPSVHFLYNLYKYEQHRYALAR